MRPARVIRRAAFAAFAVVFAFACLVAPAQAKDWRVESMDVLLDVGPKGDVDVSETVTFVFEGSFSYVARVIPTGDIDGIDDVRVSQDGVGLPEGDGPGTYTVFHEADDLVVQLNFALEDTSAAWTIEYVARGAVSYFDDVDEVVWHVFDADTPVAIDSVRVTMNLPGAVDPAQLTAAVDTGPAVENRISSPGASVLVWEAEGVFPYTHYWIAGGFPKGVVEHPWTLRRIAAFIVPKVGFALPILTFLLMLMVWAARGRDEPAAVYARYLTAPPSDAPPAVAGALIDETVERRELLATVADLARRGYLELPQPGGSKQVSAMKLRLLRPIGELEGIDAVVAGALFPHGEEKVQGEKIGERLRGIMPSFDDVVFARVVALGYFAQTPEAARGTWNRRTVLLGLVLLAATVLLAVARIGGWGYFLVGSLASVIIMGGFVRYMPQRTRSGAEEQRKWEAFRNYLRDLTRFEDLDVAQQTYDRYLPYAVAFGVERDWTRRFDGLAVPAPAWAAGPLVGRTLPRPATASDSTPGDTPPALPGSEGSEVSLPTITLDGLSEGLFGGLERISSAMLSAPSSTGSGRGAFGGSPKTSSRSSSSSGRSSSGRSRGWTSTYRGSSGGGFSRGGRGGGGGGGGGGFRAG